MVTDGHGDDDCITALRNIPTKDLDLIIGKRRPINIFADCLQNCKGGATMCLVKIFNDRIECINCGDSRVAVFKDGELVFMSIEHNWKNQDERKRLAELDTSITFTPSNDIVVVNEKEMVSCYSEYTTWKNGNRLAPTQALGNLGKTGCAPDHTVIPIYKNSNYKVVIGSDGIWDMFIRDDPLDLLKLYKMTVYHAIDFIKSRWLQEWREYGKESKKWIFEPTECDDMSIVIADIIAN
jgi:serine/threonine protein phosphatase PrpC